MIADIAAGHHAGADVLLLIGVIVFAVAGALYAHARAVPSALVAFGLAVAALGWLVL